MNGALWHLPGSDEGEAREAGKEHSLMHHSQVHTGPEFHSIMVKVMNLKRCQSAWLCIFLVMCRHRED